MSGIQALTPRQRAQQQREATPQGIAGLSPEMRAVAGQRAATAEARREDPRAFAAQSQATVDPLSREQITWGAAAIPLNIAPGAGVADAFGYAPSITEPGEYYPSMRENIQEGNYADVLYQALGLGADAATALLLPVPPLASAAAGAGAGIRAAQAARRAGQAADEAAAAVRTAEPDIEAPRFTRRDMPETAQRSQPETRRAITPEQDQQYLDAVRRGDKAEAQRLVDEALVKTGRVAFNPEETKAFSLRTAPPPQQTVTRYKAFRVVDGELRPLYVGATEPVPMGVWLDAKEGGYRFEASNGSMRVPAGTGQSTKIPNDEVRQELIQRGFLPPGSKAKTIKTVAYRPGWHAGTLPYNPQGAGPRDPKYKDGVENPEHPYPHILGPDIVIAEVELAADEASRWKQVYENTATRTEKGNIVLSRSGVREVPVNGYYDYTTNSNNFNMPGSWSIGGSLKVNRLLSPQEADRIMREQGFAPQRRVEGGLDPSAMQMQRYGVGRTVLYDRQGNPIPLSQRFSEPDIEAPRFLTKGAPGPKRGTDVPETEQFRQALNRARAVIGRVGMNLRVPVRAHVSVEDARRATGYDDIPDNAGGFATNDEIHLITGANPTELNLEKALWHEITHAGVIRQYMPESQEFFQLMQRLSDANPKVQERVDRWKDTNTDLFDRVLEEAGGDIPRVEQWFEARAVEEALAQLSEGGKFKFEGARAFIGQITELMRKIGLEALANRIEGMTDGEAIRFIVKARKAAERPRVKPLSPKEQARNLENFLGNSVVRGTVYHGTPADFASFGLGDLGFHVGTAEQANTRLRNLYDMRSATPGRQRPYGEGDQIMPVYIRLENPLRMDDVGEFRDAITVNDFLPDAIRDKINPQKIEAAAEASMRLNPDGAGEGAGFYAFLSSDENLELMDDIREVLRKEGYDGVVYENLSEGAGDSYIVLDPGRIKSASGNVGTYNPVNMDLRYMNIGRDVRQNNHALSVSPQAYGMSEEVRKNIEALKSELRSSLGGQQRR